VGKGWAGKGVATRGGLVKAARLLQERCKVGSWLYLATCASDMSPPAVYMTMIILAWVT
jgi:hypothetical protein